MATHCTTKVELTVDPIIFPHIAFYFIRAYTFNIFTHHICTTATALANQKTQHIHTHFELLHLRVQLLHLRLELLHLLAAAAAFWFICLHANTATHWFWYMYMYILPHLCMHADMMDEVRFREECLRGSGRLTCPSNWQLRGRRTWRDPPPNPAPPGAPGRRCVWPPQSLTAKQTKNIKMEEKTNKQKK